ncbi:isochorismatase family protein [Tunturiibacter gelidiferens]|uniref:isochorismatase family protein n=1 Tax=Tunturiibacter gelidiferens TaxID=3069689 RepID=UPI003D9AEFA7
MIQAPYGPQTLWPEHVLQHTEGSAFHPALSIPHAELILRKGFRRHIDSYSAFLENDHTTPTGLAGYLRERNLARLFLCGLAYDFCVRYSALDGHALGFETIVVEDATRPVNLGASIAETDEALAAVGVPRIASNTL